MTEANCTQMADNIATSNKLGKISTLVKVRRGVK